MKLYQFQDKKRIQWYQTCFELLKTIYFYLDLIYSILIVILYSIINRVYLIINLYHISWHQPEGQHLQSANISSTHFWNSQIPIFISDMMIKKCLKVVKKKTSLTQAPLQPWCFHWQRRQCVGNEGPGALWTLDRQTSWGRTCDWGSGWCCHRNGHRCSIDLVAGKEDK